ncbi:MAG: hypothetical protein ACPK85_10255 [Methanosarcina sp.]
MKERTKERNKEKEKEKGKNNNGLKEIGKKNGKIRKKGNKETLNKKHEIEKEKKEKLQRIYRMILLKNSFFKFSFSFLLLKGSRFQVLQLLPTLY